MSMITSIAELVDLQKHSIDSITYLNIMNFLKKHYDLETKETKKKQLNAKYIIESEDEEEDHYGNYTQEDEDRDTYASLWK